jgi:hypothetical protein
MHESIVAQLDAEIDRLTKAKALLNGGEGIPSPRKRGHPAKEAATSFNFPKAAVKVRSILSAKARKAIGDAQRARWAKKKATEKKEKKNNKAA